jgi:hypothetical protein
MASAIIEAKESFQ